jgi:hypothetical protein
VEEAVVVEQQTIQLVVEAVLEDIEPVLVFL